jgi:uncharacterized protein
MNILEQIRIEAYKLLDGVNSCHELEHTERVYNLAMHIGKKENADLEIISLAAFLHDIARKYQDESKGEIDHAEKGAEMAREVLKKYAVPAEKIEAIVHCIRSHRYRSNIKPESLEAKILSDADKLDGMGAIGLGRAFSFAGHIGAKVHNKNVDVTKTEQYSIDDTAWREYEMKLKFLKDRMLTNEGKRLAVERHIFMEQFFNRLNKEVDGEI